MSERVHWCRKTRDLEDRLDSLGAGPLALDTEADSLHHYPEKVCLVQLSFDGIDLLVDPLAGVDLVALAPILERGGVRKVLHGADYDLRILNRDFGLTLCGLFDTMIAARLVGERSYGLAALLEQHFSVALDKKYQRADWSQRPLPQAMEAYAVLDTRHLVPLAQLLESRLVELGREGWAAEEFAVLEKVRWSDRADGETYRNLKGSGSLAPRGLAVLREIVAVREGLARAADRPPFMIISNESLMSIAREKPRERRALERLLGSRGRGLRGTAPGQLIEAVRHALDLPEAELPERREKRRRRRDGPEQERLRALLGRRETIARELDLEPSILGSRALLETMLSRASQGQDPRETPGLRQWQWRLLGPELGRIAP
jgi:ribonuclease D